MKYRANNSVAGAAIVSVMIAVALIIGWVLNVVAIFHQASSGGGIDAMFVLRVVGIFVAPLGGVLGYL